MSNFPLTEQKSNRVEKRGRKYNPIALKRFGKIYRLWGYIKDRCYREKSKNYHAYGGRGIVMCDEWKNDSKAFVSWCLANGYRQGLDIDRIDNDGPYSPDNCRFVTRKVNCNNTRSNVKIMFRGVAFTISQLSRHSECVVCLSTLKGRLDSGWSVNDAVTRHTPSRDDVKKLLQLSQDERCTVSHCTVRRRFHELGWDAERAAFTPSLRPRIKKPSSVRQHTAG